MDHCEPRRTAASIVVGAALAALALALPAPAQTKAQTKARCSEVPLI